jgi:hypothetical protein
LSLNAQSQITRMNIILINENCSAISVRLRIIVIRIKRRLHEYLLFRLSEK